MKKILVTTALTTSMLLAATNANANNFGGFAVAINGAMVGVEASGSKSGGATAGTTNQSSTGSLAVGKLTALASIDASYHFPVNPTFTVGLGVDYIPAKADISTGSRTASRQEGGVGSEAQTSTSDSLNAQVKDHYMVYIQPTFAINKDSAFFAKVGYQKAETSFPASFQTTVTGGGRATETVTNRSPDLEGWSYSVGLKTYLTSQAFVAVEALYSDYDTISTTTTQSGVGNTATKTYSAAIEAVQARVALGFKF